MKWKSRTILLFVYIWLFTLATENAQDQPQPSLNTFILFTTKNQHSITTTTATRQAGEMTKPILSSTPTVPDSPTQNRNVTTASPASTATKSEEHKTDNSSTTQTTTPVSGSMPLQPTTPVAAMESSTPILVVATPDKGKLRSTTPKQRSTADPISSSASVSRPMTTIAPISSTPIHEQTTTTSIQVTTVTAIQAHSSTPNALTRTSSKIPATSRASRTITGSMTSENDRPASSSTPSETAQRVTTETVDDSSALASTTSDSWTSTSTVRTPTDSVTLAAVADTTSAGKVVVVDERLAKRRRMSNKHWQAGMRFATSMIPPFITALCIIGIDKLTTTNGATIQESVAYMCAKLTTINGVIYTLFGNPTYIGLGYTLQRLVRISWYLTATLVTVCHWFQVLHVIYTSYGLCPNYWQPIMKGFSRASLYFFFAVSTIIPIWLLFGTWDDEEDIPWSSLGTFDHPNAYAGCMVMWMGMNAIVWFCAGIVSALHSKRSGEMAGMQPPQQSMVLRNRILAPLVYLVQTAYLIWQVVVVDLPYPEFNKASVALCIFNAALGAYQAVITAMDPLSFVEELAGRLPKRITESWLFSWIFKRIIVRHIEYWMSTTSTEVIPMEILETPAVE